jgi:hypothetical protein
LRPSSSNTPPVAATVAMRAKYKTVVAVFDLTDSAFEVVGLPALFEVAIDTFFL